MIALQLTDLNGCFYNCTVKICADFTIKQYVFSKRLILLIDETIKFYNNTYYPKFIWYILFGLIFFYYVYSIRKCFTAMQI